MRISAPLRISVAGGRRQAHKPADASQARSAPGAMNKTYLRYELSETFGVIASPQSNAVYDSTGNLAISAALHEVAVWNLRQCSLVRWPTCM